MFFPRNIIIGSVCQQHLGVFSLFTSRIGKLNGKFRFNPRFCTMHISHAINLLFIEFKKRRHQPIIIGCIHIGEKHRFISFISLIIGGKPFSKSSIPRFIVITINNFPAVLRFRITIKSLLIRYRHDQTFCSEFYWTNPFAV